MEVQCAGDPLIHIFHALLHGECDELVLDDMSALHTRLVDEFNKHDDPMTSAAKR